MLSLTGPNSEWEAEESTFNNWMQLHAFYIAIGFPFGQTYESEPLYDLIK